MSDQSSDNQRVMLVITAWNNPENDDDRAAYVAAAGKIFAKHGAELDKAQAVAPFEPLAGEFKPDAVVFIPWPSAEACRQAFADPDYGKTIPLRDRGFLQINYTIATQS